MNDKKGNQNLHTSLANSITSDTLKELVIDGAELSLDTFMDDGLLKEIPFFGVLYKIGKLGIGIREGIFAKKIYKFLRQLKDIPKEQREQFINQLESKNDFGHKVGEKLIMLIEKLDDIEKPEIIGKLFKACINENIDYETFLRLSSIVPNAFLPDLERFKHYPWPATGPVITKIHKEHFINLGIMSTALNDGRRDMQLENMANFGDTNERGNKIPVHRITPRVNNIGLLLIKYGLQ